MPSKKEFLILAKKKCIFCERVKNFLDEHGYKYDIFYANIDFQDAEFKADYGEDATYPMVFEKKANGKKIYFGDSEKTIKKLSTEKA